MALTRRRSQLYSGDAMTEEMFALLTPQQQAQFRQALNQLSSRLLPMEARRQFGRVIQSLVREAQRISLIPRYARAGARVGTRAVETTRRPSRMPDDVPQPTPARQTSPPVSPTPLWFSPEQKQRFARLTGGQQDYLRKLYPTSFAPGALPKAHMPLTSRLEAWSPLPRVQKPAPKRKPPIGPVSRSRWGWNYRANRRYSSV